MRVEDFARKYDVTSNSVYAAVSSRDASKWYNKATKEVDDTYLISVAEERQRLWLLSHQYYYFLTYVCNIPEARIAKKLAKCTDYTSEMSWVMYFSRSLFMPTYKSIIDTNIAKRLRLFILWCDTRIKRIAYIYRNDECYKRRLNELR